MPRNTILDINLRLSQVNSSYGAIKFSFKERLSTFGLIILVMKTIQWTIILSAAVAMSSCGKNEKELAIVGDWRAETRSIKAWTDGELTRDDTFLNTDSITFLADGLYDWINREYDGSYKLKQGGSHLVLDGDYYEIVDLTNDHYDVEWISENSFRISQESTSTSYSGVGGQSGSTKEKNRNYNDYVFVRM